MRKRDRASEMAGIVLKALGISILTMWSFFDFSVYSLGVLFLTPVEIWHSIGERKQDRIWQLNLAFKDALLYLRNALSAGYSPEGGMKEALKGLEQMYRKEHRICREFRYMLSKMELGSSMEEVWLKFGKKSGSEDIQQFAEILSVVKRTGGDLGGVLRQAGEILQEKMEVKRELHTVVAAKEAEFRIMCALPHGILLYLKLFATSMSESLYHNTFGLVFMWIIFLLYTGIRYAGEWLIRNEMTG